MKQLVHWVGMSARKRVLESGRKPRVLPDTFMKSNYRHPSKSHSKSNLSSSVKENKKKELRFFDPVTTRTLFPGLKIVTASTASGDVSEDTDASALMSPSPSPRPMSAMSRRSATPTMTISGAFAGLQSLKSMETTLPSAELEVRPAVPRANISNSDGMFHNMRRRYNSLMQEMDDVERQLNDIRVSCMND